MAKHFKNICGRLKLFKVLLVISALLIVFGSRLDAKGQSRAGSPDATSQIQPYAPLGESGYKVPIPEIKLTQITGSGAAKSKPTSPDSGDSSPSQKPSVTEPSANHRQEQTEQKPPSVTAESPRLPFDHMYRKQEPAVSEKLQSRQKHYPATPVSKEPLSPFVVPVAPEEPLTARPPKKEVLMKRTPPTAPPLLEAQPSKEPLKVMPLKSEQVPVSGPVEAIPLKTRAEPEVTPAAVRQPSFEKSELVENAPVDASISAAKKFGSKEILRSEGRPSEAPLKDTGAITPIFRQDSSRSAPSEEARLYPSDTLAPKEDKTTAPVPDQVREESIPKENLPGFGQSLLPREIFKSPLNDNTPDTPEIKHYLRDTAPILEELSLLMTRAPSMTIADYDPSDANAALFPKDLQLRMDSMKRDLQILDSKTFAIIPPKKYEQFHGLIRDSITHTHQACDAIVNYIAEPNDENFKLIQEHLFRAKELIKKTRSQS